MDTYYSATPLSVPPVRSRTPRRLAPKQPQTTAKPYPRTAQERVAIKKATQTKGNEITVRITTCLLPPSTNHKLCITKPQASGAPRRGRPPKPKSSGPNANDSAMTPITSPTSFTVSMNSAEGQTAQDTPAIERGRSRHPKPVPEAVSDTSNLAEPDDLWESWTALSLPRAPTPAPSSTQPGSLAAYIQEPVDDLFHMNDPFGSIGRKKDEDDDTEYEWVGTTGDVKWGEPEGPRVLGDSLSLSAPAVERPQVHSAPSPSPLYRAVLPDNPRPLIPHNWVPPQGSIYHTVEIRVRLVGSLRWMYSVPDDSVFVVGPEKQWSWRGYTFVNMRNDKIREETTVMFPSTYVEMPTTTLNMRWIAAQLDATTRQYPFAPAVGPAMYHDIVFTDPASTAFAFPPMATF
ncbi:hypothetical protein R3P38DRAFT_2787576 [Favolaschia claudopus]|uniref:Uncharacterized protein n=1 Tax=Favolaschia claudopus TaxID=2862362 RepID=A0AAW0ANN8_9AGAR